MLETNTYFDGKVKSIAFKSPDLPATVGVMVAGDYTFQTEKKEYMTIVSGSAKVKLPGSDAWELFEECQSFIVNANESFELQVSEDLAYLCKYE
jgi:uncharacterized protein YaiE (UPF0345 family)